MLSVVNACFASPTIGSDKCFVASCLAAFIEINFESIEKTVQEPVVKSCKRVPTAIIRSALFAIVLALLEPVTPIGPMFNGALAKRFARPAIGSTIGMLCILAKLVSSDTAPEYCTPPPAIIIGLLADIKSSAADEISSISGL